MEAQNQAGAGVAGALASAAREKKWDELNVAEQNERLRAEVRRLHEASREMLAYLRKLEAHSHKPDGTIMVPLNRSGSEARTHAFDRLA